MSSKTTVHGLDRESLAAYVDKLPLHLWLRLLTCSRMIEQEIRKRLRKERDMTLAQFDYLATLYRTPSEGMTMRELSSRLMVTNGNITGLTDRLQRDGFVIREASARDRRSMLVRLTQKGIDVFGEVAKEHERWINEIFDGLSSEEKNQLMELLARTKSSVRRSASASDA